MEQKRGSKPVGNSENLGAGFKHHSTYGRKSQLLVTEFDCVTVYGNWWHQGQCYFIKNFKVIDTEGLCLVHVWLKSSRTREPSLWSGYDQHLG
jgi:predicted glycosyl hydrolase (DUF1957 family)